MQEINYRYSENETNIPVEQIMPENTNEFDKSLVNVLINEYKKYIDPEYKSLKESFESRGYNPKISLILRPNLPKYPTSFLVEHSHSGYFYFKLSFKIETEHFICTSDIVCDSFNLIDTQRSFSQNEPGYKLIKAYLDSIDTNNDNDNDNDND